MTDDLRDNRDPELMGEALSRVARQPGQRLSDAVDAASPLAFAVPDFGTSEARDARAKLNGHLSGSSERLSERLK